MTVNKFLSINSDHEKVAVVGEDGLEAVGERMPTICSSRSWLSSGRLRLMIGSVE